MNPKKKNQKKITKKKKLDKVPTNVRKIPKEVLEDTLKKINDPDHPCWNSTKKWCGTSIHQKANPSELVPTIGLEEYKFKLARTYLMRRDWINLAKILSTYNENFSHSRRWLHPICMQYTAICLAHRDRELFAKFVESVVGASCPKTVLKNITTFSGQKMTENNLDDSEISD